MQRPFVEVDVFTDQPYRGNPLAVVLDGSGLRDDELQRFATWTNFSETTFLLPPTEPGADYLVRIFTTIRELPFAGHPTLGSCHAWLTAGGVPQHSDRVVQQCGIGLVDIRRDTVSGRLAFAAPALLRDGPLDDATITEAITALGIDRGAIVDSAWIDNGPGWLGLLLSSAADVLALRCGNTDLKIGVVGACPPGARDAYVVRAFFPGPGATFEDPVTGSLNASVAQWMIASGRCTAPYTVSQGTAMGRDGTVHITTDESGQVWVGGDVTTCVRGSVDL